MRAVSIAERNPGCYSSTCAIQDIYDSIVRKILEMSLKFKAKLLRLGGLFAIVDSLHPLLERSQPIQLQLLSRDLYLQHSFTLRSDSSTTTQPVVIQIKVKRPKATILYFLDCNEAFPALKSQPSICLRTVPRSNFV